MRRGTSSLRLLARPAVAGASISSSLARTPLAGLLSSTASSTSRRTWATAASAVAESSASTQKESKFKQSVGSLLPRNAIEDPEALHERLDAFAARVGMRWNDRKLLLQALTHPSFKDGKEPANDRLEYFGDRILNFVVCEHLANRYPNLPARAMAHATQLLTSNDTLSAAGKRLGVHDFVRWTPTNEAERSEYTVVANTMEALVASLYHDQGLKAARDFIVKYILPQDQDLDVIPFLRQRLPRNTLSELLLRRGSGAPYYVILQESGRHSAQSMFVVGAYSDSQLLGQGSGQSIAKAQAAAAQDALNKVWGEKAYTKLPKDEY